MHVKKNSHINISKLLASDAVFLKLSFVKFTVKIEFKSQWSKTIFLFFKNPKYLKFFIRLFEFNPRNPISTFDLHIKGLQVCGLWSPENKTKKFLYEIYSWLLVVVFLYLFVVTQIIYLANAKNLEVCKWTHKGSPKEFSLLIFFR